jgi:hypothetical protein
VVELSGLPEWMLNRKEHADESGNVGPNRRRKQERSNKITPSPKYHGVRGHGDDLVGVGALFD